MVALEREFLNIIIKHQKVLININNEPFIYYKLKQVNFCKKIYLCTGYKGNQVRNYFRNKNNKKVLSKKKGSL